MNEEYRTKDQIMDVETKRRSAGRWNSGKTCSYARSLILSSPDMIIAVDKDRRIIEFNKAAQRTFGYSSEEILGKHVKVLYNDPEEALRIHEATRRRGQIIGEVINRRKNGETFTSSISASVLYDPEGEFIGFMGISRDITARKKIDQMKNEFIWRYRRAGLR